MKKYRIRLMTPKEVGRFMGVNENNLNKMLKSGLSDDSLCKMFGNSIVVGCMTHMFKNLFVEKPKKKLESLW